MSKIKKKQLKVLFICGSLEPGKDGVGDYTTQLAITTQLKDWKCICCAINDIELPNGQEIKNQNGILYYRFSKSLDYSDIASRLQEIVNSFQPDVCSLQLVIYGFHKRGWMMYFNKYYAPIIAKFNSHIMWHELWLGLTTNSSFKESIEGSWQKLQIMKMLKIIKPTIQHTSIPFYQLALNNSRIKTKILPLFSNFPLDKDATFELLPFLKSNFGYEGSKDPLIVVAFGTVHSIFPFQRWLKDLRTWHAKTQKDVIFCSVGRMGVGKKTWDDWNQQTFDDPWVKMYGLGSFEPHKIRAIFSQAAVGVSFTPLEGWGKSGSVLAMIESGLYVMGYEFGIAPKKLHFEIPKHPQILKLSYNETNTFPDFFQRSFLSRNIDTITDQFIADIKLIID